MFSWPHTSAILNPLPRCSSTTWRLDSVASLNLGLCVLGIVPAWFVVRKVGILADGTKIFKPALYATQEDRLVLEKQGREEMLATGEDGQPIALTQ